MMVKFLLKKIIYSLYFAFLQSMFFYVVHVCDYQIHEF